MSVFLLVRNLKHWFVLLCLWLAMGSAHAHLPIDSNIGAPKPTDDWKTLETQHFRINFQKKHLAFAQRMAAIAENVYDKTTAWMEWEPSDITEIIINDAFDGSNGGASPLPYNRFFIFMNAPVEGELIDNSPWLELVFTHEFIHILHLDQASGVPAKLRNIFGRIFFTFPQIFSPKWISEGIAVYGETDHEAGFGRGQAAIYSGMMRAELMKGLRTLTEISYYGYQGTDWPFGQVYLYGYYFIEFVEKEYGKDKVNEYIKNWNDNIIPWRLDSRSSQVFGISAQALWAQYQKYLLDKFKPTIASIEQRGVQPSTTIAGNGIANTNPVWMPNGDMYYYHRSGYDHPRIMLRKADGTQENVTDVDGFSMFDVHAEKGLLLSRAEVCDNTNIYTDLYQLEPGAEEWRRLTTCGRYPRAFWSPDGKFIVAVKVGNGQTSLVLLDLMGVELTLLDMRGLGETIGHFHWSPDGRSVVAAIKREKTGWNLEEYDLYERTWTSITHNSYIEYHPIYSADSKSIYFISDQGGALNIRQLDRANGVITTLTNTTTALLDFSPNESGDVFRAVEYTADGLKIKEITIDKTFTEYSAKPSDALPKVASFSNTDGYNPERFTDVKDYSPLSSIRPRSWWAWLLADGSDNSSIQFIVDGNDALNFHFWQVAPQWFFDKQELGGDLTYSFYNRLTFLASRKVDVEREEDKNINEYEVWDLEDRFQAIYTQPLNSLEKRVRMHVGIAQERVVRTFEETGVTADAENNLAGLLFNWNNTKRFLHSISPESGRDVTLAFEKYSAFGDGFYDGVVKSIDWREYVSLPKNNVLAFRFVYAESDSGDKNKPLEIGGNFDTFGTLGANIGFGREEFMLRGYSKDNSKLEGQYVNVNSIEWRTPLLDYYDGLMIPPLGLGKLSLTLFADTGAAWDKKESRDYYSSIGFEISPDVLIGYDTFNLNVNIGLAQGLDSELGRTEAFLRLISSF
ncbi:MAG: hypothetical protein MI867_13550 [Pseudomonadales bacterium]|nr:hypothetical protein [Pseudomonadales bacterium]